MTSSVIVPSHVREWAEARVESGAYADVGDYLSQLVQLDRDRALAEALDVGEKSGVSSRGIPDIIAAARARMESGAR